MPVPLQVIVSLLVGLGLALAASVQFEQGRSPFGREVWVPILYQVLIVSPVVVYLGVVHPDWSWLYFVDPARLPVGTVALVVLSTAAAELAGYLGGWALLRAGHRRELALAVAAIALLSIVFAIAVRHRLSSAGSFAEFAVGASVPIGTRKLGWSVAIAGLGAVVALFLSVRFLVEQGRREREG